MFKSALTEIKFVAIPSCVQNLFFKIPNIYADSMSVYCSGKANSIYTAFPDHNLSSYFKRGEGG